MSERCIVDRIVIKLDLSDIPGVEVAEGDKRRIFAPYIEGTYGIRELCSNEDLERSFWPDVTRIKVVGPDSEKTYVRTLVDESIPAAPNDHEVTLEVVFKIVLGFISESGMALEGVKELRLRSDSPGRIELLPVRNALVRGQA